MNALEQIVVTGCPTCGAPAQAIAEGEGVWYRHVDTATLKAAQGGVTEAMVERAASAFMRVRGLGMAKPWEGMLESSRKSYRPAFRAALEAALSAQQGQGEAWEVRLICCGRDDGCHVVSSYEEAERMREAYTSGTGVNPHGYSQAHEHEPGHQRAAIISRCTTSPAPPAQPAERVPEGVQSALREAAEVLQMVADSGVTLPPNWRWPLLDELSGYAYMLMDASPAPSPARGDGYTPPKPCTCLTVGQRNYCADRDKCSVVTTQDTRP